MVQSQGSVTGKQRPITKQLKAAQIIPCNAQRLAWAPTHTGHSLTNRDLFLLPLPPRPLSLPPEHLPPHVHQTLLLCPAHTAHLPLLFILFPMARPKPSLGSNPRQPLIASYLYGSTYSGHFNGRNHAVGGLLWLISSSQGFQVSSMLQYGSGLSSFLGQSNVLFRDIPHSVYPFIGWWIFGLLPLLSYFK